MNPPKIFLTASLVYLLLVTASCAQSKPEVTLTPDRIMRSGVIEMKGTGFTPKATALSHLRRPDGTEFPILPFLTNERGEFTHDIETLLLSPGVHEVWVEDEKSKRTSEVVRFEVTSQPQ
jgi:hypothetical protein